MRVRGVAPAVRRRAQGERGAIGGIEVLPFGLLVFVAGTLLVANAWAVVDAKLAVESAAREAGRAYVEAGDATAADRAAAQAAAEAMRGAGRDPARLELAHDATAYVRCAAVTHVATYRVPALVLPFVGGFGNGFTVRGRHREVLDPFAAGMGPENRCGF